MNVEHDSGNPFMGPEDIDRLIHEPARLLVLAQLRVVESADYTYLMQRTGLTWGNLSSHLGKLEEAGYVEVTKTYLGKRPYTLVALSASGRAAFDQYTAAMQELLAGF